MVISDEGNIVPVCPPLCSPSGRPLGNGSACSLPGPVFPRGRRGLRNWCHTQVGVSPPLSRAPRSQHSAAPEGKHV